MKRKITSPNIVRVIIICMLHITLILKAQETTKAESAVSAQFFEVNKEKMFNPVVALESWVTYSMGEVKNSSEYANRTDVSFRRFRFGASGTPYSWLKYNFQLYLDRLGEDAFASTKGSYGNIGIWNANITAKLIKESELLNIETGYFWAAISREYNTSPWAVGAFDKTRACWYMRNFITGTGNGIVSGIALGGLKYFNKFGISYRIGTYEPDLYQSKEFASRLYTGRIMFSFGDPEETVYKYMLSGNQWGKRKGITIGIGASTQSDGKLSDTTFFDMSNAYGADILINYEGLHIDGEYFMFDRKAIGTENFNGIEYHIRAGYSLVVAGKYIEPVITYEKYKGEGAKSLYKYIGDDYTYDLGINWYMNKDKLKLALHYVIQSGSTSPNTGDYIGLACQIRL